eukprot:g4173.t1
MSVDLGHEFFKVALMRQGVPMEIVLNSHSKRKTTTAVSYFEASRVFGDDALAHISKAERSIVSCKDVMLHFEAIISAGEIAGCRVLTLVHETSAFAVQRATDDDVTPAKGASDIHLFYNLGSRKAEVSIVRFESRPAGMVANKMVPVLTVLGSAIDYSIGGSSWHKFQEKFPKLKDGVAKNPRALRKVLSQAQKTKAVLSSNKVAPFNVESLYEDTDFQATLSRGDFEAIPIEKALNAANITMSDVKFVEVVGGAWRVPKVQQLLSSYLKSGDSSLPLGQHLNGEEAGALGAALVGANSSSSFRVKKIFFTDLSAHEYAVQVTALDGSWEKNYTVLYPMGSALGAKKKLSFSTEEDFKYTITGLRELLENKWSQYNTSGAPKISVSVPLETSGIVEVKQPLATIEDRMTPRAEKTEEGNGLVYFGNGPFAHLQHDFANLELEKRVFKRNLSQVTSLAGYAGSEPRVGGFLDIGTGYLVSHFLKTFHGPEGARDRPQPEQKGLQFRSCIGIPGGREGTLFSTIQRENANFSMDLRVGGGKDPDAFNVIWIYDTTSFPFLRAEQYLQFVRDSDDDDDKKYHGCLRNLQLHQGVIEPTGCPEWSPPGTQVSDCSDKPKTMPELCRPSHGHLSPSLRWGISADLKVGPFTAEAVCCANHRFAEEPHFWSQNAAFVAAAKAATEKNPLVFFDSACDVPLFKAPVGRNTSQWLEESAHGWPSFRSQEMVSENLVTFAGGECQGFWICRFDSAQGYCIDLVCIAGEEASVLAGKPSMQNSEFEVYFGCGRFNHVQHEFVLTEVEDLHRGETDEFA